jgi:hypothetical protein
MSELSDCAIDLETWELAVCWVLEYSEPHDSIWVVRMVFIAIAVPLMLVILDEADAIGDFKGGQKTEGCEEIMVVTTTASETGAKITASDLYLDSA